MGSRLFLPSVNSRNISKLDGKLTHLYSFKTGTFPVYWRSGARLYDGTASMAENCMFLNKSRIKGALIIGMFLAAAASLPAQTVSSVRIFTNPPGLSFSVDGQGYMQPVTLFWPQGSKHAILTPNVQFQGLGQANNEYTLGTVTSTLGPIADLTSVTADPNLTFIELPFNIAYAVDLNFFSCPAGLNCTQPVNCKPGAVCPCPGYGILNGQTFVQNAQIYVPAGQRVLAEAHPNPGWVFAGWLPVPGSGNTSQAFQNSWTVNNPITLYPEFNQARPVSVTVQTVPAGLQTLVDRTPYFAPVTLEWGLGSTHQLGGISPQYDLHGNLWVFNSWSDNGAYSHPYTVPSTGEAPITFTANYVTGTQVTFLTVPQGLALTVDGRQNYPDYTFAWIPGSTHSVRAPATQVDANGNTWVFQSWSNGGSAAQQIVVSGVATNNRYTATYQPGGVVNINSNPAGVPVQVDGQACATPCNVGRAIGIAVHVSAPLTSGGGQGTELAFRGWSDGGPASRNVMVAKTPTNLAASYKTRYALQGVSDPPNGVLWKTNPSSPDSYFDPNTRVQVSVTPKPGFEFLDWAGDASGSYPSVLVVMDAPHTVRVELNPVPYIAPGGIMNSATELANHPVAPGSAVAVFGINLASNNLASSAARLATTLESVTVKAAGQVVPLFFVSPSQINIQLPSNLTVGEHTLLVHMDGKPDASQEFTVARNAPGLFGTVVSGRTFALANHQDGSAISTSSPARHGEVISLFGTGFGPYTTEPPDGVAVSSKTKYALADAARVLIGEQQIEPVWAGAAAGRVGVAVVQLKIDDSIPHGTNVALKLNVNEAVSNTVLLPVE